MNETNPAMTDCFSGTALKEIINRLQNELLKEDKKLGTLITTEDVIYGVFFGNELAYLFINPKEQFFEDLKNRRMLAQREAMETYDSLDGEADEVKLKEEE